MQVAAYCFSVSVSLATHRAVSIQYLIKAWFRVYGVGEKSIQKYRLLVQTSVSERDLFRFERLVSKSDLKLLYCFSENTHNH